MLVRRQIRRYELGVVAAEEAHHQAHPHQVGQRPVVVVVGVVVNRVSDCKGKGRNTNKGCGVPWRGKGTNDKVEKTYRMTRRSAPTWER